MYSPFAEHFSASGSRQSPFDWLQQEKKRGKIADLAKIRLTHNRNEWTRRRRRDFDCI